MDLLADPAVIMSILVVVAHFLLAAVVWFCRRRRTPHVIPDERDRVQKKTFTKWVNKHLIKVRKHITDLYEDLRDGHNLISLLEVLSGVALPREKGRMRFHRLQNVQIALDFLKQRQVKLVNIRNDDITDGNPKLTLGLIWTIILHFQAEDDRYKPAIETGTPAARCYRVSRHSLEQKALARTDTADRWIAQPCGSRHSVVLS
ncbi:hypothetical protein DPEC_G00200400 [Dallia pectoralis]|uniref:Uncharacterized protein n=1 Tax=Dallia pectoralis TaxID=75939 RepID=A0ACC2G8C3_DALPE|nr:hypothetical protein DPEC_G00200400 [Dallia pectoralis]